MSTAAQALEAIHLALSRLNYDRKRQLEHVRNIQRHQHVLEKAADDYLRLLSRELRTRISRPKGKTPAEIAKKLVDWEAVGEEGRKIFNKALLQVAQQQAAATVTRSTIVKQSRPDLLGQKAIEWANKNSAKLVTAVNNETRKAIRGAIKTGLNQGQSIKEIARDLKPMIGLNQRQHLSVRRFREKLINAGLPKETIKKRVGRYAEKSLRYRARMIARTETAGALSDGNLMGLQAMGATYVKGIAGATACEVCLSIINGQVYKIQEAFGMIPVHPNCSCTFVLKTKPREKIKFREARTIQEAQNFARKHLVQPGGDAGYKWLDLKTANSINSGLTDLVNKYGIRVGFIGTQDGLISWAERVKKLEDIIRVKNCLARQVTLYIKEEPFRGIVLNQETFKKGFEYIKYITKRDYITGWSLSSNPKTSILRHEYGHVIDDYFMPDDPRRLFSTTEGFKDIIKKLNREDKLKNAVGKYAYSVYKKEKSIYRYEEAFAETFSVYSTGGKINSEIKTFFDKITKELPGEGR